MKWAQAIRDFFSILFQSKLVVELRREIEDIKTERDYFRGQFERMQLIANPPRIVSTQPRTAAPAGATRPGGRKTFAQLQAENTQRIRDEIAAVKTQEKAS